MVWFGENKDDFSEDDTVLNTRNGGLRLIKAKKTGGTCIDLELDPRNYYFTELDTLQFWRDLDVDAMRVCVWNEKKARHCTFWVFQNPSQQMNVSIAGLGVQ